MALSVISISYCVSLLVVVIVATVRSKRAASKLIDTQCDCAYASYRKEHWQNYALALEVFCECCAEGEEQGAENARKVIERERATLKSLGEYDN